MRRLGCNRSISGLLETYMDLVLIPRKHLIGFIQSNAIHPGVDGGTEGTEQAQRRTFVWIDSETSVPPCATRSLNVPQADACASDEPGP